jgi:hypothetical protein
MPKVTATAWKTGRKMKADSDWRKSQPDVGQVAHVWYFTELLMATWNGRVWVMADGQKLPAGLWWYP